MDMRCTCLYAGNMSKMIQVRDVPERVHSTLKARAAREGMSLSDYIKRELERTTERPTMREWLERTRETKPILAKRTAAEVVRELRDER
jgi:plasmid stability protein